MKPRSYLSAGESRQDAQRGTQTLSLIQLFLHEISSDVTETESNHYDVFNLTLLSGGTIHPDSSSLCEMEKNVNYESDVNSTASDGAEEVKPTHMSNWHL